MKPKFFKSQNDFRNWLEKNHDKKDELLVGFYKVGSGRLSMKWGESVDQALCFGWIDGVRKSLGDDAYTIRFTPRRPNSIWSAININKIKELTDGELMHPAGIAAFEKRDEKKSAIYAYENEAKQLSEEFLNKIRRNKKAWKYLETQPPWYKRLATHYVMSAKQEKTRANRLEKLIGACASGTRL